MCPTHLENRFATDYKKCFICGQPATHFAVEDPYCGKCWEKTYGDSMADKLIVLLFKVGGTLAAIYGLIALIHWAWRHS